MPDAIPEVVSSVPGSPYYFTRWRNLGVKLDGVAQCNIAEFNKIEGWVRFYIRDGRGRIKRERGRPVLVTRWSDNIEPYWR